MATSGTTTFSPDVGTLIEEAFDRAGYEGRSGYEFRTAVRSLNFLMSEWSNIGLNLWTVDEESLALTSGTSRYALATDTVDMIDQVIRVGSADYRIERIGVGSWASISNKSQTASRPNQVYIERLIAPYVNVWPVPSNNDCTLIYWRLRRMQDAGTPDKTPDIPYRFLSAMASGLSYKLYMKKRGDFNPNKAAELKNEYTELLGLAMSEDRGREPFFIYGKPR